MAQEGTVESKYRRTFICVNPDPALGPQTWNLAAPVDGGVPGGGGGGGGKLYGFTGENPIQVEQGPSLSPGKDDVVTSMDISVLDDRAE